MDSKPKKSLGQHFLTAPGVIDDIVAAADITAGETVLEIGPGQGILTRALLDAGARVIAVEKDEDLADELREGFAAEIEAGALTVITADALELSNSKLQTPNSYKLVANIPYYITGALIRRFLTAEHQPTLAVLMIQKEVAQRITTPAGENESLLSISVKVYGTPRYVRTVKAGSFNPPPKVGSAVIAIEDISRERLGPVPDERFFEVLRTGFGQKRKKLRGNLARQYGKNAAVAAFETCGLDGGSRAQELSVDQWLCLAAQLT